MKDLEIFGNILHDRSLSQDELALFFATVWAFFKDVPAGIIALSANITDQLHKDRETVWEASKMAAYVLYASVDEYGLHQHHRQMLPTHHEMFKELTEHLGVTTDDFFNEKFRLPEGVAMGNNTFRYYRSELIGEALGFHLASEMTSSREFQYFLRGFQAHSAQYGLSNEDDPVLAFFAIHCEVEPMHVSTGKDILSYFLDRDDKTFEHAKRGALAFMDGFGDMFAALNTKLS